jgi:hypothetical protein
MTSLSRSARILGAAGLALGALGLGAAGLALGALGLGATSARAESVYPNPVAKGHHVLQVHQILLGTSLSHTFTAAMATTPTTDPLTKPDDITRLGDRLFVGFQNGVGPQGEASSDGNVSSTVVELSLSGSPLAQWDIVGKCDGLTANPKGGYVIATVNEDADSSIYTIDPWAPSASQVQHFAYDEVLPHLGGTDSIAVFHGHILVSASAPGTTGAVSTAAAPAVYEVALDWTTNVADVSPLFYDGSSAVVANTDSTQVAESTILALTDPDSSEIVPRTSSRFAGDFMLDSQGDLLQIYVHHAGRSDQSLSVLQLSQSIDDTAWPTSAVGALYATDSVNDSVDVVLGRFSPGTPIVAVTPCGANSAPSSCPDPPTYPANYLGILSPWTGNIEPLALTGAAFTPQGGLLFVEP